MDNEDISQNDNTVFLAVPGKAGRTLKPGDILGDNYRLTQLIGRGGMGVVYRCQHLIIGREYALKVLSPDQVNEQSWQRFQVEGKAIAKLDHPNIVKIFNMGVYALDCPYYVMELLEGDSLETLIEREGALSLEDTLDIFAQLASGLSYAHNKGIVHRDIKPSNIILQKNSANKYSIKIVDFGLAKLVDGHSLAGQSLTSAGEVFGSPFYMSLEQGLGSEIDARADVYSLGCTLFKALTGRPPYCGENAFQTVLMHQSQNIPSLKSAAKGKQFPQSLEDLLQKMLAKKAEDRYQSMDQISHEISRLQEGKSLAKTGVSTTAADRPIAQLPNHEDQTGRKGKWPIVSAACLLVVAVAGSALYYSLTSRSPMRHTTSGAETKSDDARTSLNPIPTLTPKEKEGAAVSDKEMAQARVDFRNFQPKSTAHIIENGVPELEFYFPKTTIGELENDYNMHKQAAKTVRAPNRRPLILEVRRGSHRCTWANTWILSRIDADEIDELIISQDDYGQFLIGTEVDDSGEKPVIDILKIARNWKKLRHIQFRAGKLTPAILAALEHQPIFLGLSVKDGDTVGRDLAPCPFLKRLQELDVHGMLGVDDLLPALSRSKHLRTLRLDATRPSAGAIAALSSCPELTTLTLQDTRLSDAQLLAVSQLPHLQKLSMDGVVFGAQQLPQQPGLKRIKEIYISPQAWSFEAATRIRRALPQCMVRRTKLPADRITRDDLLSAPAP